MERCRTDAYCVWSPPFLTFGGGLLASWTRKATGPKGTGEEVLETAWANGHCAWVTSLLTAGGSPQQRSSSCLLLNTQETIPERRTLAFFLTGQASIRKDYFYRRSFCCRSSTACPLKQRCPDMVLTIWARPRPSRQMFCPLFLLCRLLKADGDRCLLSTACLKSGKRGLFHLVYRARAFCEFRAGTTAIQTAIAGVFLQHFNTG